MFSRIVLGLDRRSTKRLEEIKNDEQWLEAGENEREKDKDEASGRKQRIEPLLI